MTNVKLTYNPYFLKSELLIENTIVTPNSPLAFIFNKTLNKWLEPSGDWKGFFVELINTTGDDNLKISFVGTEEDFDDLKAANRHENIELEYLLDDNAKIRALPRRKLQDLIRFLSNESFLADIHPLLAKISSDKNTVNIVSTVKNFSAQNIFHDIAPNFNFVVNESTQNLTFNLLSALSDVKIAITLFVFDRETIFSEAVINALQVVTQTIGRDDESAQTTYDTLFFICNDSADARDIEDTLNACGFDKPKLFIVNDSFADCSDILSATDCKNFLHAPISATLKNHYAERIARCRDVVKECTETLKFYCLHSQDEIMNAERRRDGALNEIALINSNLPALKQTILTYFQRYALPDTIRKIYLGIKKKKAAASRNADKKISEANDSLQVLQKKIRNLTSQPAQKNSTFAIADNFHFDTSNFDKMSQELLNRLTLAEVPVAARAIEKNLIGYTNSYLKFADSQIFLQTVNSTLEKNLRALFTEAVAYIDTKILTPARRIVAQLPIEKQSRLRNLTETLAKVLDNKNFELPTANLDSLALENYEPVGRNYVFVKYVPVDEILSGQRKQAEKLLKERLRNIKKAAANFTSDFKALVEENFQHTTSAQNTCDRELQQLQRAVKSKTDTLATYQRQLNALKLFDKQLDKLLEI